MQEYYLSCPRGLEEVTSKDISPFLSSNPIISKGGVSFFTDTEGMYLINLYHIY